MLLTDEERALIINSSHTRYAVVQKTEEVLLAKLREQNEPGTGSELASKLKTLAMNWCSEHAQPVVCGSLNQRELYARIDQVCVAIDSPTAPIPECKHRLIDVTNERVMSGFMCVDCGKLFAAARSGE